MLNRIEARIVGMSRSFNSPTCTDEEVFALAELAFCGLTEERAALRRAADRVRNAWKGDGILVRGLIEFSNHCSRKCAYCGISAIASGVNRYRLNRNEILAAARTIRSLGIGTVVLQSGEDFQYSASDLAEIISCLKRETALDITVSAGERDDASYEMWKTAGMDRYLLRFETSSADCFARLHADGNLEGRIGRLKILRDLGIETGSGFLMGLPGTGYAETASDIILCRDLRLHMIGAGPFIPCPGTPLEDQSPGVDAETAACVLAVVRLACPWANIPATTAFDAMSPGAGRVMALQSGANVVMPNFTPGGHCTDYALYPGKPSVSPIGSETLSAFVSAAASIGRHLIVAPSEMAWEEFDPAEVHALFCTAGWCVESEGEDLSWAVKMLRGTFLLAGYRADGKLVAFGRAISDGACDAYIQDIVVHPDFRRRGLGRDLVMVLASGLRARGITWTALVAAPGTEKFYIDSGFEVMEGHVPMLWEMVPPRIGNRAEEQL